jgi:hypothetical protein
MRVGSLREHRTTTSIFCLYDVQTKKKKLASSANFGRKRQLFPERLILLAL